MQSDDKQKPLTPPSDNAPERRYEVLGPEAKARMLKLLKSLQDRNLLRPLKPQTPLSDKQLPPSSAPSRKLSEADSQLLKEHFRLKDGR